MVHKPSWHRGENVVLDKSPESWEEAREDALLTWDVDSEDVYRRVPSLEVPDTPVFQVIDGWKALSRDDTTAVLTVQPTSYQVIRNEEFGRVMDTLLGMEGDEHLEFEALMSLYEGRMIVAVAYFEHPLLMSWDPSKNYTYCGFASRHDGQGGMRGIPTNVRIVCANTFNQAEMIDGRTVGFTIRHTLNWEERVAELRAELVAARGEGVAWTRFTEQLALFNASSKDVREKFIRKFLPISDAMTNREKQNREASRSEIRKILASKTCEGIRDNGYGLLMASSEWSDHSRRVVSDSSYVSRQLLRKEPSKTRAAKILREMADITI